jgi:hypothetical protein
MTRHLLRLIRQNFLKWKNRSFLKALSNRIAPELAAILRLGSERLPVRLKSFRTSDGVSYTFAVSTNPSQKGIVISALKTMGVNMKIYSVVTA